MKLTGSFSVSIHHASNNEWIETLDVNASEFGLEETGVRHYGDEKGYRGLFIYSDQEYGFDILVEIEEINHRITEFDSSVRCDDERYDIDVSMDELHVHPSSGDYEDDEWY